MKTRTAHTAMVAACVEYLTLHGIPAWKANTGAARYGDQFVRYGTPGMADVLFCLPPTGRLGCAEIKTGSGRLTPDQAAFHAHIRAAGGLLLVVRSLDDLIAALEDLP